MEHDDQVHNPRIAEAVASDLEKRLAGASQGQMTVTFAQAG